MISVEEAKKLIQENGEALVPVTVPLMDALGSILAENIISPVDLPPFDQSAMDGYAINFPHHLNDKIKVIGEVPAGRIFAKEVFPGEAVRIFTGAEVPKGADTVVMQEKVRLEDGYILIEDTNLVQGLNIRNAGSQIKEGSQALTKGTLITPGGIGYLAGMGITEVEIVPKPRVSIIVTGSELVKPGQKLGEGKIYESNSYSVEAALQSIHIEAIRTISISDDEAQTLEELRNAVENSDLLIFTGGISVGDYDFVGKAFDKLGVKNIFYKIKQKPGKPLFFGKYKHVSIFGLPGNPAAVLSCFYEYVYPVIRIMSGHKNIFLPKVQLPITTDYSKRKGLSLFLKGKRTGNAVMPLEGQESYMLSSFALADCLIYLPAEGQDIKRGEMVEVHLLPFCSDS